MDYACPFCGTGYDLAAPDGFGGLRCQTCNGVYSLPEPTPSETQHEPIPEPEVVLNAARVRLLSARKRAAGKVQGYWVLASLFLLVGGLVVLAQGLARLWAERWILGMGLLLMGMGLEWAGVRAAARARRLELEVRQSELKEIQTPPDFTSLGNGAHRWEEISKVR